MLRSISEYNRADALMLLRWVTYAQSPRTLHELAEATIIEIPDETGVEGAVDMENRGVGRHIISSHRACNNSGRRGRQRGW
jgi:hypothetical protein